MNRGECRKGQALESLYLIPSTESISKASDASGFGAVKVGTEDPVCVERPFELTACTFG